MKVPEPGDIPSFKGTFIFDKNQKPTNAEITGLIAEAIALVDEQFEPAKEFAHVSMLSDISPAFILSQTDTAYLSRIKPHKYKGVTVGRMKITGVVDGIVWQTLKTPGKVTVGDKKTTKLYAKLKTDDDRPFYLTSNDGSMVVQGFYLFEEDSTQTSTVLKSEASGSYTTKQLTGYSWDTELDEKPLASIYTQIYALSVSKGGIGLKFTMRLKARNKGINRITCKVEYGGMEYNNGAVDPNLLSQREKHRADNCKTGADTSDAYEHRLTIYDNNKYKDEAEAIHDWRGEEANYFAARQGLAAGKLPPRRRPSKL
jgi:hypothetical protein